MRAVIVPVGLEQQSRAQELRRVLLSMNERDDAVDHTHAIEIYDNGWPVPKRISFKF